MNAVMKRLESGKATVKGLRMLYPVTDASLFRVVVKGISFSSGDGCRCSNGPAVIVAPVDGVGDMTVEVTKLVDDSAPARDEYFRRHKAVVWKRENRVGQQGVTTLRRLSNELIAELKPAQRTKVEEESGFKLTAENTAPSKLNQYEWVRLIDRCLRVKFSVENVSGD